MRNIGRIITVAFVITLLFSFRCWAEVSYLDPFNGQISSQPVSRTFTGDGSHFVDFPIPTGEWQQLKLYLEAVIPENSNYAYISVDFGGEGLYGTKSWNQNSPGINSAILTQPLGNDGNNEGGEDGDSNGGGDYFSLYSSLDGDNDGEGVTLKIVKIELVPEVVETPGTLIGIQSAPETIQTDRGGNSQPVELLAIASPETSDGTTVKFLVKNQETGEVIFKKKAPVIEGQAGVIWSPEAEDVSIPSASFKITATAGDNKVKTDISAKQLDVDYLGAGSLNSSPDPL
ncbi:MAG: hypothetical protein AB1403_24875, partial [Candidatus Riflebacteria bacterium]